MTEVTDGENSGIAAKSLGCGTSLRREGPALEVAVMGCGPATEDAAEVTEQPVQDGLRITICWCCASLTVHNIFSIPQLHATPRGGGRNQ